MTESLPEEFTSFRNFVLDGSNEDRLLGYIKTYTSDRRYTGAYFHDLSYEGPSHPDRFDIADIASLSLLSVTLGGKMAQSLTEHSEDTIALSKELARETDRDLGELTTGEMSDLESNRGLSKAWLMISNIHGIGRTRTSKLLARKRPHLIPIWDSVISRVLGLPSTKGYWTAFHTALTADDRKLDTRLAELSERAGVSDRYSRIRVLDILAWMYGKDEKDYQSEVLTELDIEPDAA